MTTDDEMGAALRALGRFMASELLQESARDLAVVLRSVLADSPRLLLLMDRPAAEDFADKVRSAIRLCDSVSDATP